MSVGMARLITGGATIAGSLSVFLTPSQLFIDLPQGGGGATSNVCFANVSDGTPPYTYLWTYQSGFVLTITNPTLSNTAFSHSGPVAGIKVSTYKCTVTDSLAAEAFNFVDIDTELLV